MYIAESFSFSGKTSEATEFSVSTFFVENKISDDFYLQRFFVMLIFFNINAKCLENRQKWSDLRSKFHFAKG